MNDGTYGFLMGVIAGAVLLVWAHFAAFVNHNAKWEKDAVKHGYAEYYLDHNNDRQWRWKESK